ncbi:MAG TPA: hypothetical protein VFG87_25240 [Amycolatopsis sp.]|jgi:hypothetical protein|nr:hypothetical protein [Amycolatopsis sp.]
MRVVHDRRRSRPTADRLTVDDLLTMEAFDAELLGPARSQVHPQAYPHAYPAEPDGEPRKFLPPPRAYSRRPATPPREPESRLAKVAKLAGLTTAGALLIGAVVASSMVTRARTDQAGRVTPAPPPITGAAALGGFAMQGGTKTHRGDGSSAPSTSAELLNTQQASSAPAPSGSPTSTPSGTSSTLSSTAAPVGDGSKLALVKEFYQRMGSQRPQDALAMLAPELAGDQAGDLVRAWSSMSRIEVLDTSVESDGSVLAVVSMRQQDGTTLQVTEKLQFSADTRDVISQAVLLSARQL